MRRALIESAVNQLAGAGLLEGANTEKLLSRRDVGRKLALAGSCAALVATITAPTPAKASSQDPTGWHTAHRSSGWNWPKEQGFGDKGKGLGINRPTGNHTAEIRKH